MILTFEPNMLSSGIKVIIINNTIDQILFTHSRKHLICFVPFAYSVNGTRRSRSGARVDDSKQIFAYAQSDHNLRCPNEETYGPELPTERAAKTDQNWEDAQADPSLRWAHISFCWFCHVAAQI